MPPVVLLTFDHLHLGYLGPYGNEWIETPNWNRLASEGVTFDQCLADVYPLHDPRHTFWRPEQNWLTALRAKGVRIALVTDASAPKLPEAYFDEVHHISGTEGADATETDTTLARLMVESGRLLARLRQTHAPCLLWIRCRGVPEPWLPPREFMDLYFEEFGLAPSTPVDESIDEAEDSAAAIDSAWDQYEAFGPVDEPVDSAAVQRVMEDDAEAEVLHDANPAETDWPSIRAVYAGYVSFLDRWLTKVLTVHFQSSEPSLLVAAAISGEDFGELERSPDGTAPLHSLSLRIPLIVHSAGLTDGSRRQSLVQLSDIPATIADWFGRQAPRSPEKTAQAGNSLLPLIHGQTETLRTEVRLQTATQLGLWTPDYFYVRNRHGTPTELQESARLYEKPHDRWDHASVAMLAHGEADDLELRLSGAR